MESFRQSVLACSPHLTPVDLHFLGLMWHGLARNKLLLSSIYEIERIAGTLQNEELQAMRSYKYVVGKGKSYKVTLYLSYIRMLLLFFELSLILFKDGTSFMD